MADNPYERDEPAVPEDRATDPDAAPTRASGTGFDGVRPGVADDDARPAVDTDAGDDARPAAGSDDTARRAGEPGPAVGSDPEPYPATPAPEPYPAHARPRSESSGADTATWPAEPDQTTAGDDVPTGTAGRDTGDDATTTFTTGRDETVTFPTGGTVRGDEPTTTFDGTDRGADETVTFPTRDSDRESGSHQAERPVPRSGLSEHESAGYLTGERVRPEAEPDRDSRGASWLTGGATGAAAGAGTAGAAGSPRREDDRDREPDRDDRDSRDRDAVLLDGATVTAKPRSRARSHVWAVVLTLLLTPVAWYLLADAGARLTLPAGSPWETGNLNVAALLELGGGLLVLVVVLLAARWSSLGAIITGSLVLVVGVPFVAVPTWTQEILEPAVEWLHDLGDFGSNVAHHLVASGSTGRLVVYGLALILIGVVSHGARRQGRREVRPVPAH